MRGVFAGLGHPSAAIDLGHGRWALAPSNRLIIARISLIAILVMFGLGAWFAFNAHLLTGPQTSAIVLLCSIAAVVLVAHCARHRPAGYAMEMVGDHIICRDLEWPGRILWHETLDSYVGVAQRTHTSMPHQKRSEIWLINRAENRSFPVRIGHRITNQNVTEISHRLGKPVMSSPHRSPLGRFVSKSRQLGAVVADSGNIASTPALSTSTLEGIRSAIMRSSNELK